MPPAAGATPASSPPTRATRGRSRWAPPHGLTAPDAQPFPDQRPTHAAPPAGDTAAPGQERPTLRPVGGAAPRASTLSDRRAAPVDTGGVDAVEDSAGAAGGRAWVAALPVELDGQRRLLHRLVDFSQAVPLVTSLSVGCSLGRGAADALSDVDAALGVAVAPGGSGAQQVTAVEQALVDALPGHGPLVDVLRHRVGPPDRFIRRVFAQFDDGLQLDVAVLAEPEVRRGRAAPDFVSLYRSPTPPGSAAAADSTLILDSVVIADGAAEGGFPPADEVSAEQVREWAFLGWCALADAGKYLHRGSLWEAHTRLHETRHHIWALWAATTGALYPWHGLSQVLDHDPQDLPPGIETTVTGLDPGDLRRAARATADVLAHVSELAATRHQAQPLTALGQHVTARL